MDAKNVTKTALLTLAAILGAALLGAVIYFILLTTGIIGENAPDTEPNDTQSSDPPAATTAPAETKTPETAPPETIPPETTAEPESTAEPPPEASVPVVNSYETPVEMYALYNVNARMRPTVESDIMVMLYQGDPVNVYGETDNGWYFVKTRGYDAYIRMDLLTADASQVEVSVETYSTPKTMYTQSRVNVRESYTTNSAVFELYEIGVEVTVIGHTSNGWYQISYKDGTAYINDDYVADKMPVIEPDREA